ncbi:MAG: hypothetical protein EOO43_23155 [Flavobacterium sp.]|nr:MAG: hypothetical protein EOO43_23155 [Flavobacterium sp.]
MKNVILYFPDTFLLSNFILQEEVNCIQVSNFECKISGIIEKQKLEVAIEDFGAITYEQKYSHLLFQSAQHT